VTHRDARSQRLETLTNFRNKTKPIAKEQIERLYGFRSATEQATETSTGLARTINVFTTSWASNRWGRIQDRTLENLGPSLAQGDHSYRKASAARQIEKVGFRGGKPLIFPGQCNRAAAPGPADHGTGIPALPGAGDVIGMEVRCQRREGSSLGRAGGPRYREEGATFLTAVPE